MKQKQQKSVTSGCSGLKVQFLKQKEIADHFRQTPPHKGNLRNNKVLTPLPPLSSISFYLDIAVPTSANNINTCIPNF